MNEKTEGETRLDRTSLPLSYVCENCDRTSGDVGISSDIHPSINAATCCHVHMCSPVDLLLLMRQQHDKDYSLWSKFEVAHKHSQTLLK